ncbi:MAG: hypothetical protein A2289_02550 [Deltaproteobacteria bacterium RIFOXYA12_FULL_58_15]|nr:MAG: hypothetical protein A2289_02550 [Deltaproteobacteria bacterium RIFOXYA12_FULL_58_15]OGR09249.1 MAG: hypothetical protein A2341_24190 [Deltaproteobacteria bacterium RIFOXYB12_FULL_58_9]
MDNTVNNNTGLRVKIDTSRTRQAPKTDFGSMVGTGLSRTANAVMDAGSLAAPFIPGGAVLSAAITGVGSLKSSAAGQTASGPAPNSTGLIASSGHVGGGALTSTSGATTAPPSTGGDMMSQMQQFQEMNQSFNMQYLGLQQQMQSDNRQYTSLSNIMKIKHDTVKASINNIR